ncbi:Arylsulfatase [Thalassoglobus neptunius]|uniref:Arylsulfatase n=1 Tax=Thalassoglobus neptunius TaxID=1938619 RepID=A0A5C5X1G3_9PLAN|nr:arylsulfatase [Thalassoglobus neptunius]TWT56974.1 Arylsulfatase [Thalassoglobus neptunius]
MKRLHIALCFTLLSIFLTQNAFAQPNIILILLDDAGYGDFSCYDPGFLKTPAIDQFRKEGMKFTQFYAGSTVCAPSRCVLLTGKHSGHARVRGNSEGALLPEDLTIAEVLQQAGYRTACIGKWGVGAGIPLDDPNRNGFDHFFGYVSMWHAHNFYPEFLVRDGEEIPLRNVVMEKYRGQDGRGVAVTRIDYAPEILSQAVVDYISASDDQPFFLYYALNVPHTNNEGGRDNPSPEKGMEVPDFGSYADQSWPGPEKGFAAMMQNIDRSVQSVLDQLKKSEIDDNTLVLISSDNGPHQEGGHIMEFFDSNSHLTGKKRDLYEGGIRVPLLVRWPNKIRPDTTTDHLSAFQDILPTVAEIAEVPVPNYVDGISFLPTLLGESDKQDEHDFLYWEFTEHQGKRALRKGPWKLVQRKVSTANPTSPELYNLDTDVSEQNNLAKDHPDLVKELTAIMDQSHTPSSNYPLFPDEASN